MCLLSFRAPFPVATRCLRIARRIPCTTAHHSGMRAPSVKDQHRWCPSCIILLCGVHLPQDCIERDMRGAICPRAASTMIGRHAHSMPIQLSKQQKTPTHSLQICLVNLKWSPFDSMHTRSRAKGVGASIARANACSCACPSELLYVYIHMLTYTHTYM